MESRDSRTTELIFLAGNSHPELSNEIARRLGVYGNSCKLSYSTNHEAHVDIGITVRNREAYLFQTGTRDVNNSIMELLIMAYACKTSGAKKIVGIIPYMSYSIQSKMRKRGCIVSKLIAKLMCNAGLTHVITIDLHNKEIQGFFDVPVDNLRASPFLLQYIQDAIPDYKNGVIVAKDPESARKTTSYAERLRIGIAVIHGENKRPDSEMADGRNSPPPCNFYTPRLHDGLLPLLNMKSKPPISVVGDVRDKVAIMVDCLLDEAQSFTAAAGALKESGASKVFVLATHGLFSGDSVTEIEESCIDAVVVTNTVPHGDRVKSCRKIKIIDVSVLICEAIRRTHFNESMSYLFRNVTLED